MESPRRYARSRGGFWHNGGTRLAALPVTCVNRLSDARFKKLLLIQPLAEVNGWAKAALCAPPEPYNERVPNYLLLVKQRDVVDVVRSQRQKSTNVLCVARKASKMSH